MSNEMMKREMQGSSTGSGSGRFRAFAARIKLGSARNWGIFDMLGGELYQ